MRELDAAQAGGDITELASYVLLPIIKILGMEYEDIHFSHIHNDVDLFYQGIVLYKHATASFNIGLGVKPGDLVINRNKGYTYIACSGGIPNISSCGTKIWTNRKFFYKFDGDGLRVWDQRLSDRNDNPQWKQYNLWILNR